LAIASIDRSCLYRGQSVQGAAAPLRRRACEKSKQQITARLARVD
jgi:hypothetical protein